MNTLKERKIVNVDVDDTLTNETCFTPEECLRATPKKDIIGAVDKLYQDHYIVIYTARRDNLIPATLEWLRRNNVRWHAFSNQKPPSDAYIDDKAVHISDVDNLVAELNK